MRAVGSLRRKKIFSVVGVNMKKNQFYKLLVGLLFSAVAIGFFVLLVKWVLSTIGAANDSIKATSITAIVTIFIFFVGRYFEQSRERKARINQEKIAVYKKFFDFYFDIFSYEKIHGVPKPESEIMKEMLDFQKDVVFWGSDQVLRAYLDFKDKSANITGPDGNEGTRDSTKYLAEMMRAVAKLLVAMRKDIGYSFTTFEAADLARLQLSYDYDTKKVKDLL